MTTAKPYKKGHTMALEPKHKHAFKELKTRMCTAPVLCQPNLERKFFLQVNALGFGMGTILLQEGEHSTPSLLK